MPLKEGSSQEAVSNNIGVLMKEHYPRMQAIAIALSKSDKPKYDRKNAAKRKLGGQ